MPTADTLLKAARAALAAADTPALDARLLFLHVTGQSHAALLADPDMPVSDGDGLRFQQMVARRAAGEPVSRIIGLREFYGRPFTVTPAVLDPRPDTEVLVEAALARLPHDRPVRLLDLGTGSGILAITLLAERPLAQAVAVDVSEDALAVAAHNAAALGVGERVQWITGSWFSAVTGAFDGIVSNPPYIPLRDVDSLARDVRDFDPSLALFGGADGLSCYRAIAAGCPEHLAPEGFVAVEIGAGQGDDVTAIFNAVGLARVESHEDLGGHERALVFVRGPVP